VSRYEHDIFISYRRSDLDWVRWTRENFARALETLLRPGLGSVRIFLDEQIETGASWPQQLALSLARSRLMVPVLSRDYFQSKWCRVEFALMHQREQRHKFRTAKNPFGLIIPVVIDDGDQFPALVKAMQAERLHEFANPFIRMDSPKQEALSEILKKRVCPAIESALTRAPNYHSSWEAISHSKFEKAFKTKSPPQKTVPSLTLGRTP
jgi:hypothetical protein